MTIFKAAQDVTPISNIFIEKYMPPASSAVFSVIYIYALKYAVSGEEISNGIIAERLGILESDVVKAWDYWAEQGVVTLTKNGEDSVIEFNTLTSAAPAHTAAAAAEVRSTPLQPEKPIYSAHEIEGILKADVSLHQLIKAVEKIYAKPFSAADLNTVIGFSTWLGLPYEVIMLLFSHCEGKPMRYIEKTACDWADKGINSAEAAESYINTYYSSYREIMSAFGMADRNPVDKQISFMNDWLFTLKMPVELIKLACERTVLKTGKASFEYANGIILDWSKKNVRTLPQLELYDAAFKQKKASQQQPKSEPKSAPAQVKTTKFVNYNQPTYSDEQIEAAIKRKKQRSAK